mmetsp:Transcript_39460/g.93606  ORF Transcript_39460/g.93606 Transcript_39460/m.93606 type:complete len:202 (+) Transcript_39460:802-1407(+)
MCLSRYFMMAVFPIPQLPSITITTSSGLELRRKSDACAIISSLPTMNKPWQQLQRRWILGPPSCGTKTGRLADFPFSCTEPTGTSSRAAAFAALDSMEWYSDSEQRMCLPRFSASPASRAAVLTVSPMTVYSHLVAGLPTIPQKQEPLASPAVKETSAPSSRPEENTSVAARRHCIEWWFLTGPGSPKTKIAARPFSSTVT